VLIERKGHYVTSDGFQAEVYEKRVVYCLRFVWPPDAGQTLPFGESSRDYPGPHAVLRISAVRRPVRATLSSIGHAALAFVSWMLSTRVGSEFETQSAAPQKCGFKTFSLQFL
jgi:hypothetical protein